MMENILMLFMVVLVLWGMVTSLCRRAIFMGEIGNIMAIITMVILIIEVTMVQEISLAMEINFFTEVTMAVLMAIFLAMVKNFSHEMEAVSQVVIFRRVIPGMVIQLTDLVFHRNVKYVLGEDTQQLTELPLVIQGSLLVRFVGKGTYCTGVLPSK